MHLRRIEHLENCRPKWKMHTQERQLTRFLHFTTDLQRKPKPNWRFFKTKPIPNWTRSYSQNRTELEKSTPHIPSTTKVDTGALQAGKNPQKHNTVLEPLTKVLEMRTNLQRQSDTFIRVNAWLKDNCLDFLSSLIWIQII